MVSEMTKGKTLEEVMKITPRAVADELERLPKQKFHCSNLRYPSSKQGYI
jgi:nitrogen fixation NifU-like protein